MSLRIVVISDTHGMHEQIGVPEGDVLIHAGDLTAHGELDELRALNEWLGRLPHRHKLVIAGNHDWICEEMPTYMPKLFTNGVYLCDSPVQIAGRQFYGSPWQPRFMNWAFNLDPPELRRVWAQIPSAVDVLITHSPPQGMRDLTVYGVDAGCAELRTELTRIRPRLHVFGHIHEGYGIAEDDGMIFGNASSCTVKYQPINPPLVFELEG